MHRMELYHGIKAERNLKFHLVAAIVVIVAGLLTGLSVMEWFIVITVSRWDAGA